MILGPALDFQRVIKLRGIADVYEVGGRIIARRWPRRPLHPNSEAQLANWDSWRLMIERRKSLNSDYIAAYRRLLPAPGRSYDDHLRTALRLGTAVDMMNLTWNSGLWGETWKPGWWDTLVGVRDYNFWDGTAPVVYGLPSALIGRYEELKEKYEDPSWKYWFHPSNFVPKTGSPFFNSASNYTGMVDNGLSWFLSHLACYKGKRTKPIYEPADGPFSIVAGNGALTYSVSGTGFVHIQPVIQLGFGAANEWCTFGSVYHPRSSPATGNRYEVYFPSIKVRVSMTIPHLKLGIWSYDNTYSPTGWTAADKKPWS